MSAAPVFVVVTLAACAAGVPSGSGGASVAVSFETILDEVNSGLHERRREVVRDEAAWARLWAQIHEGVTPQPALPPVDFSRDMLIAVATGTRPTGGFDIKIRSVTRRGGRLEVMVLETCPAPGDRVSMGLTQPVEVVRLERLSQAPTFQETRSSSCR
jgi:hypothetical protein